MSLESFQQITRHGSDFAPSNHTLIDFDNRNHFGGGTGQKTFVGHKHVVTR